MRRGENGMALPLVLVLLLALTALGHGSLLLARRELQASAGFRRLVQARRLAEGGLAVAIERLAASPELEASDSMVVLAERDLPAVGSYRVELLWLGPELFLLEGRGIPAGGVGEDREGWVGWRMAPSSRLGALTAVVEVGGEATLEGLSRVEGGGLGRVPEGWPSHLCVPWEGVVDSLYPAGTLPPLGSLDDVGPADSGPGAGIPPLGLLSGTGLLLLGGGPSAEGLSGSVAGCPEAAPLRSAAGSVTLAGGVSCGVLAVLGDLHLTGGHRLQGLVLVGGDLVLDEGAVMEGMARVGGSLRLRGGSRMMGSACAVLRSLGGSPVLRQPIPLPEGSVLRLW